MPDGFALANAFVRIRPEATGFRADADAKIRAALAGIAPNVKIGAETKGAKAAALDLKAYLDALTNQVKDFRLVVDDKQMQARLARIFTQLIALQGMMVSPKLTLMGFSRMQAELLSIGAEMDKISGRVAAAHVDVTGDAEKQLALLRTQIVALTAQAHDIKLGIADAAGLAAIAAIQKALAGVASHVATLTVGADVSQIAGAERAVRALADDMVALTARTAVATTAGRAFGGWLGVITARIPLFGGLGPALLTSITAWHLLVDVAIEFLAVLIPATIALIAFGVAGAGTAQDIFKQMQNVNTVTTATNRALYPMTARLRSMADSVQPQVYQLFGDALTIVNSRAGTFTTLAKAAGTVMDQLAARTAIAIQSGGMSKFLHNAASDLARLGDIVGNIFGTIGNLLKTMPGYAQILLGVIDSVSKGLERVTGSGFSQGIIKAGLAFHGAAVYIGLAATAASSLVRGGLTQAGNLFERVAVRLAPMDGLLGRAGIGFMGLAAGAADAAALPWGWIALAAAAVGFLVFKLVTAKDATQRWFASLQQVLMAQNAVKGFTTLQVDQAVVTNRLAFAQRDLNKALLTAAKMNNTGGNTAAPVNKTSAAYLKAAQASRDYGSELQILNDQSALYNVRLSKLAITFGGVGQAQGILLASGITMNQMLDKSKSAWLGILQQVQATQAAYKAMGQTGGILGADMNALNIAASDQVTAMGKLNSAWDTVIGIVTGGQTSFITFQQDLLSVNQSLVQAGGSARIVTNTFAPTATAIARAAAKSGASMSGLNAASLQLRATWQTAFSGGASLIDALRLMSSASAGGFPPVTRAIKDVLRELTPLGSQSKATRAELVSMAQEINPNIANFSQLTKWLGNTKNAGKDLNKVVANMGVNLQNLAKDASGLYATLQSAIIKQFDVAKLTATGASKAISTLATDITTAGTSASKIHSDEATLFKDFTKSGLSAKDATTLILSMTGGISLAGLTSKQKHAELFTLYNDFRKAGLGAQAAAGLVHALTGELFKVPKNVHSNVTVSTPHAFIFAEKSGGVNNPVGELHVNQSAKGSRVPGYGGGDKHLYLLEGGEAVVSKETTARHAKTLAAMGVPGMAGGGLAGMSGRVSGALGSDSGAALLADVNAALKADVAAGKAANTAAAALNFAGGPGGGAPSANAALARKLMPAWASDGEWNAWNALAMAESGWSSTIRNASSGALGIAQALGHGLPGTAGRYGNEYPSVAANNGNPTAQIEWMISYIRSRYGDPIGAVAHENAFHWYRGGTGGAAKGWGMVGEAGPEMVKFHGGETVLSHPQTKAMGYAKGTKTPLNAKVDKVLAFIRRNANNPVRYTHLAEQLQPLAGAIATDKLLLKSGQLHGHNLVSVRREISRDTAERNRLAKQIRPYEQTRQWVRGVESGLVSRDKTFASEAGAALTKHMPNVASRLRRHVKADTTDMARMNQWLNRLEPATSTYLNPQDRASIHSNLVAEIRAAGLPLVPFDKGGWLRPGRTMAINNTGRSERVVGPGEAQKVVLEFKGGPTGQVERALWLWLQKSIVTKGGGNVQSALGRK